MLDETLLHWENLTRLINDYKPQGAVLRSMGLFPARPIEGQQEVIDIIKVNRTKASAIGKRSPSVTLAPEVIKRQPVALARSSENVPLPGATLLNLRNPGSMRLQKIASDQIAREVKKLGGRLDYRNEFYMASALQGSVSDTIDGVAFTMDYNFAASHKPTIGGNEMSSDSFQTDWSDSGADIAGDVAKLRQKAREDGGYEVTTALASPEVLSDISKNDYVSEYLKSTPEGVQFVKSGLRGMLFGINWVEYGACYKDGNAATQRFLPEEKVCFLPDPDPMVMEFLTGDDVIPTADKSNIQSVNGRYSYSSVQDDPAGIKLISGEVSLPVIYVPGSFFVAEVYD